MSLRMFHGDPLAWPRLDKPSAVAIGVFDGVHLGHRRVMRHLTDRAATEGLVPTVLTFDPHPLEFLSPEAAPDLLTSIDERAELIDGCGVEVLGVLPFPQIRDMHPRTFVEELLALRLGAKLVTVGENFRFGRDRAGDPTFMAGLGETLGFKVEVVDMYGEIDGMVVSSTRIREALSVGDVALAGRLLGRLLTLTGTVIHGDARGRSIGFPTANIHVPERMAVPANGVYGAFAEVDGERLPAVVNIGVRPTFGLNQRSIEAHILDFDEDIYGARLRLHMVDRVRAERRFTGIDELRTQIGRDVDQARELLARSETTT